MYNIYTQVNLTRLCTTVTKLVNAQSPCTYMHQGTDGEDRLSLDTMKMEYRHESGQTTVVGSTVWFSSI